MYGIMHAGFAFVPVLAACCQRSCSGCQSSSLLSAWSFVILFWPSVYYNGELSTQDDKSAMSSTVFEYTDTNSSLPTLFLTALLSGGLRSGGPPSFVLLTYPSWEGRGRCICVHLHQSVS